MKARRSKYGAGKRGDKSSPGGSPRKGGAKSEKAGSASPKISRGPGARASGKGNVRTERSGRAGGTGRADRSGGGLERAGKPTLLKGGVKPHVGSVVEGIVSANRAGYGFLRVDGMKDSVFIPPKEMNGVMHGDRLKVKLAQDSSDRWSGAVEQVVSRGVSEFLGTVDVQGRSA